MRVAFAALALVLPLLGCGAPVSETGSAATTAVSPSGCVHTNGAWCLTTASAAPTATDTQGNVHWTLLDPAEVAGVIVEPPSCRGRAADGVYRRSVGTVLRAGETWKIARVGLREDRSCELLFMAPESAAASLETVFLTRVNVCRAGTDCAAPGNVLAARIGDAGLF